MTTLQDLYQREGQSPWLDNLRRDYLRTGRLRELVELGIRGLTSNPTIMAKAIASQDDYDDQMRELLATHTVEDTYWELVLDDIAEALAVLRPVHDASGGIDGYVSVEVAPGLAYDQAATEVAARDLHRRLDAPNLYVKIPATAEGVPAIRTMIGEGHSINVTLIFGIERYLEVMEAYLGGLEDRLASGVEDLSPIRSVASFFVSRVDTEVDRRLDDLAAATGDEATRTRLLEMRGRAAVAQARVAYEEFRRVFSGPRWEALAAHGATLQRPLWASTSTKNPAYPDLLYVDGLIGSDTVNTMPDQTIEAFLDHGTVLRTVDANPGDARRALGDLGGLGVDMADVAQTLEDEGVAAFSKSFDELIQQLSDKAGSLGGR